MHAGRGDLPRYLSNYLLASETLVWENARENAAAHCYICTPQGRLDPDQTFNCDDWFYDNERYSSAALDNQRACPSLCLLVLHPFRR